MGRKHLEIALFLAGLAVSIIFFLLPKTPIVVVLCLLALFAFFIHPVIYLTAWVTGLPPKKSKWQTIIAGGFLAISVVVFGFYVWPEELPKPDVALHFVHPKAPALVITNLSDAVARDIKWAIAVWNMDIPDRNDPLPIPVSTFDWIKAHDEGGPQGLFHGPLVAPLLKPGNRLFGSASVACPECIRGRTYIIYIELGNGGWFSEVENETSGQIIIPPNF